MADHTLLNKAASAALPDCNQQTTAALTEIPRGPQLLRQLRDLPALPFCVTDGQAQNVRAVGERRDCQTINIGPQLWLCGCCAAQLTLPVHICKPRSWHQGLQLCCAQTPLVARTEPQQACVVTIQCSSPCNAPLYGQWGVGCSN